MFEMALKKPSQLQSANISAQSIAGKKELSAH